MLTPDALETMLMHKSGIELIEWGIQMNQMHVERKCQNCNCYLSFVEYSRAIDKFAYRCMNKLGLKHKEYTSLRKGTFFQSPAGKNSPPSIRPFLIVA